MGGDHAPNAVIEGVQLAIKLIKDDSIIVLFGDENIIKNELTEAAMSSGKIEIVHCSENIEMGDHPAKSFQQKTDASIPKGFSHLKQGLIDGFASAGSTGAMMVGSMLVIGAVPGVLRPTICTPLGTKSGKRVIILDAGLNADCKPEVLEQYATIGSIYAENVFNISNPRIALLNIGEEPEKGNLLTKAAYPLLKENKNINFVGNLEANHLFDDSIADVVVCDGFAGNTLLKVAEGVYNILKQDNYSAPWIDACNYEVIGGTPVLGIENTVIIAHGHSSPLAIQNMILSTEKTIEAKLESQLRKAFETIEG